MHLFHGGKHAESLDPATVEDIIERELRRRGRKLRFAQGNGIRCTAPGCRYMRIEFWVADAADNMGSGVYVRSATIDKFTIVFHGEYRAR